MDFGLIDLDEPTRRFCREVREFFEEHVTEAVLEDERRHGGGFSESLHLAMGKRGWVAPRWPLEEGGADLTALQARVVAEELARSGAPYILASTTMLPPIAIRMFGSPELQAEIIPKIADGTARICLGYTEPDCGSDLAAVRTRAVRDGDAWVINGQKMFTTGAQHSQFCFLLARTNSSVPVHKGLTVFLLPMDTPGVEIRPIGTLGGERTNFVYLQDVRIEDRWRLGDVDSGWGVIAAPLAAETRSATTPSKSPRRISESVSGFGMSRSDGRHNRTPPLDARPTPTLRSAKSWLRSRWPSSWHGPPRARWDASCAQRR